MTEREKPTKLAKRINHNLAYAAAQQLADAQATLEFIELLSLWNDDLNIGTRDAVITELSDPSILVTRGTLQR